jgi:hypothetical protein
MGRTYEALRRAEAKAQRSRWHDKQSEKEKPLPSNASLETRLDALGLGKDQILSQNLKEIGQSLNRINACMASPPSSLNPQSSDSQSDMREDTMLILIERKKLILNRLDVLVSQKKYYNIYQLLSKITDIGIKTLLEKNVKALQTKEKIIKKEYQQLEQLHLASASGPPHHPTQSSEIYGQTGKLSQRSLRKRKSLGSIIIVALLICLTAFIAVARLLEIQLSHLINLALFILWGFLFGMTVASLAGFGKKD